MKLLKNLLSFNSVLLLATCLVFLGCGNKKETPKNENLNSASTRFLWAPQAEEFARVKISNQYGEAIANAKVLIGSATDTPFVGNLVQTDSAGIAKVPKAWTSAAHVTVEADGYVRMTLLNQNPGDLTLKLNPLHLAQKPQLTGQVTQLPVVNGDKFVDFGMVMPALSRGDLLNFDINQVISPFSDILSVAGQDSQVPTNISLPTQKESYIFSFTISKPVYRLQIPTVGQQRFFAARGRFVFKDVANELRAGKPFYELINYFSILGGGLRETNITSSTTTLDIPASEIEFKNTFQVQAAPAKADEVMLTLAASQLADTMVPTDIKRINGGQNVTLTTMADKPAFVISVIQRKTEFMTNAPGADRISVSLESVVTGLKQKLLPLVANPSITTTDGYNVTLPPAPTTDGVFPIATSVSISDLTEVQASGTKILLLSPRWEVIGLGWNEQVQLPKWALTSTTAKMRVGINYIGSSTKPGTTLDESSIESATHVTHASTDF